MFCDFYLDMGDKINRLNFLKLDGLTFSFKMTNHLDPLISEDEILTKICQKISKSDFKHWTRIDMGAFAIPITLLIENELFRYLDEESKEKRSNWLIFLFVGDGVLVTHFGPLGLKKNREFEDKVEQTRRSQVKIKDVWDQERFSSLPKSQDAAMLDDELSKILAESLQLVQNIEEQIEGKKRELKNVAESVFDSGTNREHITNQIDMIHAMTTGVLQRQILRRVVREITVKTTIEVAKVAGKQSTKAASKKAAKTTAKATPIVGLCMGAGYALWRLTKGDVVGAGLEMVSGAASCAPGVGTAVSLAIDAGLVGKDVIGLMKETQTQMEALKADTERIEIELNNLFEEYEKAKPAYDIVSKVLGDPGYDVKCAVYGRAGKECTIYARCAND